MERCLRSASPSRPSSPRALSIPRATTRMLPEEPCAPCELGASTMRSAITVHRSVGRRNILSRVATVKATVAHPVQKVT